jgi:putative tricarboxylic transport membrane protein
MAVQQVTGVEAPGAVRSPDGGAAAAADLLVAGRGASAGVSIRAMEVATSLAFAFAGAAALWDSLRLGAGWGADGPQSGYFPFWIGLLLVLASAGNLVAVARAKARDADAEPPLFLSWEQARTVGTVFVPTLVYVAAIPFTGIYLASALLVAWFMVRLGGFGAWRAIPAGAATALVTFLVFEIWFLVALPKGPLEEFLGY